MLLEWAATSVFLILAVLLLRAALGRRISASLRYALWGLVLLRLLVPVQLFTSPVVGTQVLAGPPPGQTQAAGPALPAAPEGAAPQEPETGGTPGVVPVLPDAPKAPAAPAPAALWPWLGWAWLSGSVAVGAVLLAANLRFAASLRRRRVSLEETDCPLPVYLAEDLPSPCLFGLFRPAVYVSPETADDPAALRHVLAHEYTHFRHLDHIWNLLRCAALAVHWWDPLVWLAAGLSRRDGELACDEGALKRLGDGERSGYGNTLLSLVTAKPGPGELFRCATTMAGDKKSLTERVKRIAHASRPAAWAAVLAVSVALLAVACAFSRVQAEEPAPGPTPTPAPAEEYDPLEAVIRGAASFSLVSDDKTMETTLDGVPALFDSDDPYVKPQRYAAVDLDGDGVNEYVIQVIGAAGDTGGWLVLYAEQETVCGYKLDYRAIEDLKADGTFSYSLPDGTEAGVRAVNYMNHSGYSVRELSRARGVAWEWERFQVNGETATEEEWSAAQAAQAEKPDAQWRDLP